MLSTLRCITVDEDAHGSDSVGGRTGVITHGLAIVWKRWVFVDRCAVCGTYR